MVANTFNETGSLWTGAGQGPDSQQTKPSHILLRPKNLQGKAGAHLCFNAFGVIGMAVPLLAGLPGVLCLSQVHIFFYRDCDDLSGLPSLARLRPPRSNIQQLGQEHYTHSEKPGQPMSSGLLRPQVHTKHSRWKDQVLRAQVRNNLEVWGGEKQEALSEFDARLVYMAGSRTGRATHIFVGGPEFGSQHPGWAAHN